MTTLFPAPSLEHKRMPDINPFQSDQQYADASRRLDLVDRFNAFVGPPNKIVARMQRDFVAGQMAGADARALVSLYERTIDAAGNVPRP